MDFRRCYEDGYKDHMEELSETDKAFMAGIEKTYEDIEVFAANADDVYDEVSETDTETIARIKKEIRKQVLNDLRDWIRSEWYETVISMLDECEDGKVKVNDEYKTPEPLDEEDIDFDEE